MQTCQCLDFHAVARISSLADDAPSLPPAICGDGNLRKASTFATGAVPLPKRGCAATTQQEEQAPIARLSPSEAHSQDLACYLFPQCVAAHEANDLAVYSRTYASSFAAVMGMRQDFAAYDDGVMEMPPGTWRGDAEYCLLSGFLDIPDPDALLQDRVALQQKVHETCSAIPEELKSTVSLAQLHGLWARMNNGAAAQSVRPIGLQQPFINRTEAQIHSAGYCASGSMDCMLFGAWTSTANYPTDGLAQAASAVGTSPTACLLPGEDGGGLL
eukprot:CAMPEP_0204565926 /NCGR_PEP_ID=MMETSP0661-20131031/35757_1 /ASSEMBLY_ACC=CAM_ASM_000606 /TAXON_ID=109239 /ORGANISM="Alexandrium margalefi, Strain AMGDE01CS-322" /LENGTH=271 /DNA_ID=CAMNT_0051573725 /DNA_START=117 /DNA_END=933 /DNA_ORIENTATION=-